MKDTVFNEIRHTINVISILEIRQKTFHKELDFFISHWDDVSKSPGSIEHELYYSAFMRLTHEVMFLIVDTYSFYEGVEKKKSLFSKVIKQNSSVLSKVYKSPSYDHINFIDLGIYSSQGHRESTPEEKQATVNKANKKSMEGRKHLKNESGIKSSNHSELNDWQKDLVNDSDIQELKLFRQEFAHRIDNLEKLHVVNNVINIKKTKELLELIKKILSNYKKKFQIILTYTCSEHYEGMYMYYDSLSRLKSVNNNYN